jgi:hypothetical protein
MSQRPPIRDDEDLPEPPQVRRLRHLVSTLMVVLIGGMLVVVVTMVLRLGLVGETGEAPAGPIDAAQFTLPKGAEVVSVGRGPDEVLILTRDVNGAETLRAFDAASGDEKSATPIMRE